MNHVAVCSREALQPYQQRNYILHDLDDRVFDALNEGDLLAGIGGYCLDALDYLPAGGMEAEQCAPHSAIRGWPRAVRCERGVSLAEIREREAETETLIAELLSEEAQ